MPYRFATEKMAYDDYASGRVFYHAGGQPALPIRLVREVFSRYMAIRRQLNLAERVVIYDPCCGSAYHLGTLAYFHWHQIDTIIGSDIDEAVLGVAKSNLSLLTDAGLARRANEIAEMQAQFGKPSHVAAAESEQRLRQQLRSNLESHEINTHLFNGDATNGVALKRGLRGKAVDIVLADIPYGRQSSWTSTDGKLATADNFLWEMLGAITAVISSHTVVAIVADKAQKCRHDQYERVEQFQIGKRRITLLHLVQN